MIGNTRCDAFKNRLRTGCNVHTYDISNEKKQWNPVVLDFRSQCPHTVKTNDIF